MFKPAQTSPTPAATGAHALRAVAPTFEQGEIQAIVGENGAGKLFIFDEPTAGVDVGAKAKIYRLLGSLLQRGARIIMISSYLPEVCELADTLHFFHLGGIAAGDSRKGASQETILTEAICL